MRTPLISIITVVYNGEKFLEKTIQSVINQSYENIEYIIIDGGSTDRTVEIIKKYEDSIDYWVSEKDGGIYDAMNKGLERANGEFVNFMNGGDEFFDSEVLAKLFVDLDRCENKSIFGKAVTKYKDKEFVRYESFEFGDCLWYESHQPSHQAIFFPKNFYQDERFDTRLKIAADVKYIKRALATCGYCYRDLIVANFEFGGVSTYFGSFSDLKDLYNDLNIIYSDSMIIRYKYYILNSIKFLVQRVLGKERYLDIYTNYLLSRYSRKK